LILDALAELQKTHPQSKRTCFISTYKTMFFKSREDAKDFILSQARLSGNFGQRQTILAVHKSFQNVDRVFYNANSVVGQLGVSPTTCFTE
jgi:hypothetical protein